MNRSKWWDILNNENTYSFWKKIWDAKGESDSKDLLYLDGYEHLNIDFSASDIILKIKNQLLLSINDSILEVGCGAGFLGKEIKKENEYTGVDYSFGLIEKHRDMFGGDLYVCSANSLPFKDKSFDCSFTFGVFQYFPSLSYAEEVLKELERVTKKRIFIGDVKMINTRETHQSYPQEFFLNRYSNVTISKCLYDKEIEFRYNVTIGVE